MSTPPAGWYPDPTGQPNTIRWWNGSQWTNKTEKEGAATEPAESPTATEPTQPAEPAPAESPKASDAAKPAEPSTGFWSQPDPEPTTSAQVQQGWGPSTPAQTPAQPTPAPTEPVQPAPGQPTPGQPAPVQPAPGQPPQWGQDAHGQTSWQVHAGQQPAAANPWQAAAPAAQAGTPSGQTSQPGYPSQQSFGPPLSPSFEAKSGSGGGGKAPMIIAAAVILVLVIAGGIWYLTRGGDKDPQSGGTPQPTTQPTSDPTQTNDSPTPTKPSTPGHTPGQSRRPILHGGNRIASDAISYPRLKPPWSDRKRFARQVINSAGQYVLLQENVRGQTDWYATIFVGALSTAVLFNGDAKATANDLALQFRNTYYDPIPIRVKPVIAGPAERSGKRGWVIRQLVETGNKALESPTLLLTVAVFDLGDGTAVAYVSEVPTNRRDLQAFEKAAFKAVTVG